MIKKIKLIKNKKRLNLFKNKKGQVSIELIMVLAVLIIVATLLGIYYIQTFNSKKAIGSGDDSGVINDTVSDYDDYFNNTSVPLIFFKKEIILGKFPLTN